ncbi:MAG: hypothetical protein ACFFAO_06780 [Candidatus Hermodarchaeota archaeon]
MNRIKILRIYLVILGLFVLIWSVLSHWFFSDFYHQVYGFEPGSYNDTFVKIIGALAIFPALGLFFSARDPIKNRDLIATLIISSTLLAISYIYLINYQDFPILEYINAISFLILNGIMILLYPWKNQNHQ